MGERKRLRELFEQANKEALHNFIDELDSSPKKRRVTVRWNAVSCAASTMMDGLEERGRS